MNRKNWLSALLAVMMVISMMACIALPAVAVSDITQVEAEALPLASTATKTDEYTKYQINSIDELLRASHASVTSNPTGNGSTNFASGDTIYITADLDLSTWDPSNFATYDEETTKYTTIGNFVVNKGTLGATSAYLKYSATAEGVECDTKEEVFAYLYNGFNARAALYTYMYADIDGLGHTISNLYSYCSFLVGDTYSTVSNLTFKNCTVDSTSTKIFSGWTSKGHAILMRSCGSAGAAVDNVHLVDCNVVSPGGYTGALLDLASNDARPMSIVNCSMVGTTVTITSGAQYQGLLIGNYRTKSTLTLENVLVYDSKIVAPTRTASHGLLMGYVCDGSKTATPTLEVNNIAVINCAEEITTVGSTVGTVGAFTAINQMLGGSSVDNVYFAGNTVSYTAKVAVEGSGTQMTDPETGEPMVDPETGDPVIDPDTIQYNEVPTVDPVNAAIVDIAGNATAAAAVVGGTYVTETAGGEAVYAINNLKADGISTEIPAENQVATLDLAATVAAMNETSKGGLWRIDDAGNPVLAAGYALNISFIDPNSDKNEYITHSFYTDLVTGKLAYNADFTAVDPDELDALFAAADKTGMIPAGSTDAADVIAVGDGNWAALKDKVYDSSVSYEEIPYASRVYVNDGIKLYQIHNIKELVEASSFENVTETKPYAKDKNGLSSDHLSWIHLDDATCTSTSNGDTYQSSTLDFKDLSTYPKIVITDDLDVNDYTSDMWLSASYDAVTFDADFAATDAQVAFMHDYRGFGPRTQLGSYTSGYFGVTIVLDGLGHTISNYYDGDPLVGGNYTGGIQNLVMENARVVTGAAVANQTTGKNHSIVFKGIATYGISEVSNVHIRDSYLEAQAATAYIGVFSSLSNKATHYWNRYKDCSVTNTSIYAPKATMNISLLGYCGDLELSVENFLALNNTIETGVTPNMTDGTPSIVGMANQNRVATVNFVNVAAIGNTFIGTETESPVSVMSLWNTVGTPTAKIDNIYAVNNMRNVRTEGVLGTATPITLLFADRFNEFKLSNKKLNFTNVGGASAGVTMIKHTIGGDSYYDEATEIANTLPLVSTEADAIAKLNAQGQNYADWYKNAEGDYVLAYAYNKTQDKYYDYTPWKDNADFGKVLAEAGESDTVVMGLDATLTDVALEATQTLDLSGNTLTVDSIIADGQVIDAGNGRGAVKGATVQLAAENAQMALYDTAAEAYRLFDYQLTTAGVKEVASEDTEVIRKFGFFLNFTSDEAYELLNKGAAATKMTFAVTLTGEDLAEPLVLTFDDYLLGVYAGYKQEGKTSALTVIVSGMESLTDILYVTANATSNTQVAASAVLDY